MHYMTGAQCANMIGHVVDWLQASGPFPCEGVQIDYGDPNPTAHLEVSTDNERLSDRGMDCPVSYEYPDGLLQVYYMRGQRPEYSTTKARTTLQALGQVARLTHLPILQAKTSLPDLETIYGNSSSLICVEDAAGLIGTLAAMTAHPSCTYKFSGSGQELLVQLSDPDSVSPDTKRDVIIYIRAPGTYQSGMAALSDS